VFTAKINLPAIIPTTIPTIPTIMDITVWSML
jgi:hypothetical protein